eukprot:PRCOL_00001985-RA
MVEGAMPSLGEIVRQEASAVRAVQHLTALIRNSSEGTLMGLERELTQGAEALKRANPALAVGLGAACDLFMRYVTRTSALESGDFSTCKLRLIERGEAFAQTSSAARQKIAAMGTKLLRDSTTVLIHGFSRCVLAVLYEAAKAGRNFSVVVTEGRPDAQGLAAAQALRQAGVPVTICLDAAAAYVMERVDIVLVGAEGVVENGGIVNKLGTYQLALAAKALGKPVYVAAESFKMVRLYPLNQQDLPEAEQPVDFGRALPAETRILNPIRDYTPPELLTLLVTDLGLLTPSAVSDMLITLHTR